MAKSSGLGMTVTVDSSDTTARIISNDIGSVTISTPKGVQDITGVDKSTMERLLVLGDASIGLNGFFNPDVNPSSHGVFSTVPSTSVIRTTAIAVQAKSLTIEAFYADYQLSRAQNGEMTFQVTGLQGNGGAIAWA
jgi:hypothetical protein